MPKRSTRDSLTGGTKDVNPQWLKMTVTQTAGEGTNTTIQPLPVTRLASPSQPTLVEVLQVNWYQYVEDVDVLFQGDTVIGALSTKDHILPEPFIPFIDSGTLV